MPNLENRVRLWRIAVTDWISRANKKILNNLKDLIKRRKTMKT